MQRLKLTNKTFENIVKSIHRVIFLYLPFYVNLFAIFSKTEFVSISLRFFITIIYALIFFSTFAKLQPITRTLFFYKYKYPNDLVESSITSTNELFSEQITATLERNETN